MLSPCLRNTHLSVWESRPVALVLIIASHEHCSSFISTLRSEVVEAVFSTARTSEVEHLRKHLDSRVVIFPGLPGGLSALSDAIDSRRFESHFCQPLLVFCGGYRECSLLSAVFADEPGVNMFYLKQ
jgi:hypothetical protein